MSEHHEEAHTGPIKTPRQLLMAVFYSFVVPVFIIIGLVYYVTSANKPAAGSSNAPEAVAARRGLPLEDVAPAALIRSMNAGKTAEVVA